MDRQFDVIVVGSGLGGLTAGALAARSGRKVLVLEKNPTCGGAARVYKLGKLAIESSLHELDGLDPEDPKMPILDRLSIQEHVRFLPLGSLWEVRSPLLGDSFVMPDGIDAGLAAAATRFPEHRAALDEYFSRIVQLRSAMALALRHQRDPLWWVLRGGFELWPFIKQMKLSLGGVLDGLFGSGEAVKLALCANLIYYTADPDRMWFPHWAVAQASYHRGGHYPFGGSNQLSEYLASYIRDAGGEVETGRLVTRILVDQGRVTGVEHRAAANVAEKVRAERASLVFGNAAPHALAEMLPTQARTKFLAPYSRRPVSLSLYMVALGFDRKPRELGVGQHSTCVFPGPLRETAAASRFLGDGFNGEMPHYIFVDYSHCDTGLATDAPYLGTVTGVDSVENWNGLSNSEFDYRRERWIAHVIQALEDQFPGISKAIVQRSMTTASSAARYLGTPAGAIYGFAPERRAQVVDPKTPIQGLWLTSAWAGLGGYTGAILGGGTAVKSALKESWRDWARA